MRLVKDNEVLYNSRVDEIAEYIDNNAALMEDFLKKAKDLKEETNKQLSEADKKRNDLEHLMEFNDLNAADGYKAYKMLQQVLRERRTIKDNNFKLDLLLKSHVGWIAKGNYSKEVDKLEKRTYHPRILKKMIG